MLYWTNLLIAMRALFANKLRLVLTMLGIIIGVGAVIAMLAIGDGARETTLERFKEQGVNLMVLRNSWGRARRQFLSLDEWRMVQNQTRYVDLAAPEANSTVNMRYSNNNGEYRCVGITPDYFIIRNIQIEEGRLFTEEETMSNANVCVIGPEVVEELFDGGNAINEVIYVGNRPLRVVGVTHAKGEGWDSPDNRVFAPLEMVMNRIIGQDFLDAIHIRALNHEIIPEAEAGLVAAMRSYRELTPMEEDNFRFFSMTELIEQIEEQIKMFRALLGGVAAVSLLVGGIGIMNIMLVTVTERTREIGVRKALGARRRDILFQFLVESVVVSIVGAGLGIAFGWSIAYAFDRFTEQFNPIVTSGAIILSVTCASAIGLVFGIYPAARAARLDPIEALRHE